MDSIVSYDSVKVLLANPPSIEPRPNFFNLRALRTHFARALKRIPCPQSGVNGWAGAIMSPEMYALIDPNAFHLNIATQTNTPDYPDVFDANGNIIPYTREQKSTIDAEFLRAKNYFETWKNIYRAVYDALDVHVNDAFKVAPATTPPTTGWNATMLPTEIFDQLQTTYGKPSPDAMRQNNLTFLAVYNPQDPPELLFKRCADCQEIAILAKVPYTSEQLMMNVIDLLTRSGMFVRDLEDWDRKPSADRTWINLRPFIQESYQRRISSGTMTSAQGGYSGGGNRFAGLTTADEEVSDDDTAETIAGTISSHMANLSLQTAATLEANRTEVNASLQQMAANQAQLHQQQQQMMHQMAMISFTPQQGTVGRINNRVRVSPAAPPTSYAPPAWAPHAAPPTSYAPPPAWAPPQFQQPYQGPQQGGRGGRSHGGRIRRARGGGRGAMPAPMPFIGGQHMIPYIPRGAQQQMQPPPNPRFSNIVKLFANQNVCFTCGFDVEDWHTSATCPNKKSGHQDGFTRSNHMEYEQANHQFCRKAMHKTMYPSM